MSYQRMKGVYRVTDTHVHGFFEDYRFLSSFHLHSIEYEDIVYPSNENAYQASKILVEGDQPFLIVVDPNVPTLRKITKLDFAGFTPTQAKSKGRMLSLRADWLQKLPNNQIVFDSSGVLIEQVRDKIMYELNVQKFSNPYLKNLLLSSGDKHLEETNWWKDDYWGVCNGDGLNKLGRILMKIRSDIRSKKQAA